MLYCDKCQRVWEEDIFKCPRCRNSRLRPAASEDEVFLQSADLYTAQRLEAMLTGQGLWCRLEVVSRGSAALLYDSQAMPTDQNIFVRYQDVSKAKDLSAILRQELAREREQGEEKAGPPNTKRIVGEIVSIVAFLLLVMLAVFGADAAANFLKGLF